MNAIIIHRDGDGTVDELPADEAIGWCEECERADVPVIHWSTPDGMEYVICRECIATDEYVELKGEQA
jgi:hypothetical protein